METSVACVVILEDGQKKKAKLQTGLQDELLLALSSLTSVSDDTLIQMYDEEVDDFIDLEPDTPVHNKAKIKLSRKLKPQADDSSHLIVYGETVELIERHNEWLHNHAEFAHQEDIRPRLLATAQERHEHLQSLNISEALVLFPFLASEASLLLEFDILYKKNVVDEFSQGCQNLRDLALRNGDDIEVAKFSEAAGGIAQETVLNCMQANVVFGSCVLLRLRKSTTDVTTSTNGRIAVLPGLARGAFPEAF
ncbi:hypothetical protein MRX96_056784 [Rhipicephalus microplus]